MAQIVPREEGWGSIIGEGLGQGMVATLQRLIDEKARKIDEKHEYERNLKFLKGAGYKNAEQLAHGTGDQLQQLLKSQGSSKSNPSSPAGNGEYNQLLQQYDAMDQGQQQETQELEKAFQGDPTPEGYANPKIQIALNQYLQSPEAQQQYTPEQLQKAQQKLQSFAQKGQSSPTQQLMGQQQTQGSSQGGLSQQDKLYDRLLGAVPNEFEFKKLKARKELREPKGGVDDFDELIKKQPRIIQLNKPFNDSLNKELEVNKEIYGLTNTLLEEENKGETPENSFTKGYAYYTPGFLNAYNSYRADTDKLALLLSQKGARQSVYTTQLNQASKPNVSMDKEDRVKKLEYIKDKAEAVINLDLARQEIKAENGGLEPLNLEKLTKDRFIKNVLPDPSEVEPNTKVEAYGIPYKLVDGKWKELSRGK